MRVFRPGNLPYVNYGADDGLPQEDIFSIFQDRKGYLWFGTNSGAVRYNGREMIVYNHEQGLPGNSVRDIKQDSSGMMYFATTSGIAKFRVIQRLISFWQGFPSTRYLLIPRTTDGLLVTMEYIWKARRDIRHLNAEFSVLPNIIYHITEDPGTGHLLMATILGVFMYDRENERITQLSNTDSYSLYIDANDSIWISTREGLYITQLSDLMENRL